MMREKFKRVESIEKYLEWGVNRDQAEILFQLETEIYDDLKKEKEKLPEYDETYENYRNMLKEREGFSEECFSEEHIKWMYDEMVEDYRRVHWKLEPSSVKVENGLVTALEISSSCEQRINYIPEIIGKLTSLRSLTLTGKEGTGLTQLPESISILSSLEHLDVSANALTRIPESYGKLSSLKVLDIRGNNNYIYSVDINEFAIPESLKNREGLIIKQDNFEIPESLKAQMKLINKQNDR